MATAVEIANAYVALQVRMPGVAADIRKSVDASAIGSEWGKKMGASMGGSIEATFKTASAAMVDRAKKELTAATNSLADAESKLNDATRRRADAAAQAEIAELKLNELRDSGNTKASTLATAEENLRQKRLALIDADSKVARASEGVADAQKKQEDATKKADDAASKATGTMAGYRDALEAVAEASETKLAKGIAGVGTAAAGAVTAIGGIALFKGFQRLDAIDTAQAKLRGLGHDAETVDTIMTNALASVKGTAFGLGDAAGVAAQAVAAGITPGEDLERVLKTVANTAAAAGTDLGEMGSIFSKAMTQANGVQNDVLSQLADRGIPIYQALAEQLGVTAGEVFELASAGEISFEQFAAAAESAGGTVAAEMGTTWSGLWDNMMASLGRGGANLLQEVFPAMKEGVSGVTELFSSWEDKAKDVGAAIGDVIGWVKENQTFVTVLAVAIGGLVAVITGVVWAVKAWTAAVTLWKDIQIIANAVQTAFNALLRANPIGLIVTAIGLLVGALIWFFTETELGREIWANFTRFLGEAWENIVAAVSTAATWLWESVISPVFEAIRGAFEAVGAAATWLYENAIKPVFDGIAAVVQWLWDTIILPYITLWINIFRLIGAIAVWLFENAIKPAWEGIQAAISAAWTWIDQNVFQPFNRGMDILGIVVKALWETYVVPAWQGIQDAIGAAWSWIDTNIFQPFKVGIGLIGTAFENVAKAIGIAWDGIKAAAAVPVNFVLGTIWNDGILAFWNTVVTELGLSDMVLPKADLVKFASGGVLPGYTPGRDVHHFFSPTGGFLDLSGGEAIMRPEFTRFFGGASGIAALNAAARTGTLGQTFGQTAFANGGVWEGVTGFLNDVWENISNAAAVAKEFITDPAGAIEKHIVQGIIQPLLGTQGTMLAKAVGQLPINLVRGLVDNFVKAGQVEGGPFVGGKALERVQAMLGSFPELYITSTYRTPAEDLAVGGTGHTRHTRIEDPAVDVAGPIEAMNRFAMAAAQAGGWYQVLYNNIDYPGVTWWAGHHNHVHVSHKDGGVIPKLYDEGGWLPHGGMAVNLSGRPERVLSPAESVAHESPGPMTLSSESIQELAVALMSGIRLGSRSEIARAAVRRR